ncbi:MAG: hypothetical protein HY856_12815 [Burkholderiales bacterium]|nr:hypothetical protein [Burkholderiales bacterium]
MNASRCLLPMALCALLATPPAQSQSVPTDVRIRLIRECVAELQARSRAPEGADAMASECIARKVSAWRAAARGEPLPPSPAAGNTPTGAAGPGTESAGADVSAEFFALQASIDFLPSGMPRPTPALQRYCEDAARDRMRVSAASPPLGWSQFIQAEPMVLDWAMQQLPGCSNEAALLAHSWLESLRLQRVTRMDVGAAGRLSKEVLDRAKATNARRVAALQPLPPLPGRLLLGQRLGEPLPQGLCEPAVQVSEKTTRNACLSSPALKLKDPRSSMLMRRADHYLTRVSQLPRTGLLYLTLPEPAIRQASDQYTGQRVLVIDGVLHGVSQALAPRNDFLAQMVRLYGEPLTRMGTVFNEPVVIHEFQVPGAVMRLQCQRRDASCSYAEVFTPTGERFMGQDLIVALRAQFQAVAYTGPADTAAARSVARQYSEALDSTLEMNRQLDAQRQQALADQQRREQEESQRRQREWEEQQRRQQLSR